MKSSSSSRKYFANGVIAGAAAFLLLLLSQRQAERELFMAWQTEEYSHGMLIPLVALLLGWNLLARKKPVIVPSWWGVGFLVIAGLLQIMAQLSAFEMAAEIGLIVGITGLCLAFLGRSATWALAPALFYLIFAVPLPHLVQANLSQDLQLWSSTLGVGMLDLLGISVYQEGNVIDLGGFHLQVVEACSGLRYLFPLMSFGYLLAFLLDDRMWKRILLFLSTIPITLLLNSVRIAFIGLTVNLWGEDMARGFIHGFEGWTVFLCCIAVLTGEIWILQHIGTRGHLRYELLGLARGKKITGTPSLKSPGISALAVVAVFACIFEIGLIDNRTEILPEHSPLDGFPLSFADWRGRVTGLESNVLKELQLSDYWMGNYERSNDNAPVNLYIAYYATQHVGSATHSPSNCIPGGGWQIDTSRVEAMPVDTGKTLHFTRLIIRRGEHAQLVYYWFEERGRNLTETTMAKWWLLWDSITMHRTDGALVRLVTPLGDGETETSADARLQGFVAAIYPKIQVFIPGAPK